MGGEATDIPQELRKLEVYVIFCTLHIKKRSFQLNYSPLMASFLK